MFSVSQQPMFTSSLSVPGRRISEDDISMCELTNNDTLDRPRIERFRRRRRQESDMNRTVIIICASYFICNLPAAVVLIFDPSAELFPEAHIPCYSLAWINPVINPWVYVTFNVQYREAFIRAFKTTFCCCLKTVQ